MIVNRASGDVLGVYPGENERAAYAAMTREAGYESLAYFEAAMDMSVKDAMAELEFTEADQVAL